MNHRAIGQRRVRPLFSRRQGGAIICSGGGVGGTQAKDGICAKLPIAHLDRSVCQARPGRCKRRPAEWLVPKTIRNVHFIQTRILLWPICPGLPNGSRRAVNQLCEPIDSAALVADAKYPFRVSRWEASSPSLPAQRAVCQLQRPGRIRPSGTGRLYANRRALLESGPSVHDGLCHHESASLSWKAGLPWE